MLDDKEYKREYPNSEDILVSNKCSWHEAAYLNRFNDGWSLYSFGYLNAAKYLVYNVLYGKTTIEKIHLNKHTTVYPIIFLYRHYLELKFKELIFLYSELIDESFELGKLKSRAHNLKHLWNLFKDANKKVDNNKELNDNYDINQDGQNDEIINGINAVDNLLKQLDDIDSSSMEFRYPCNKNGEAFFNGEGIDLRQFAETMEKIEHLLEILVIKFSCLYEVKEYLMEQVLEQNSIMDSFNGEWC